MIGNPIQVYPLYENSLRAHRNQSFADNHKESVQMYGEFAEVARKNPYAWNYELKVSEEDIATVSKRNRMICLPCEYPEGTDLVGYYSQLIGCKRPTTHERV